MREPVSQRRARSERGEALAKSSAVSWSDAQHPSSGFRVGSSQWPHGSHGTASTFVAFHGPRSLRAPRPESSTWMQQWPEVTDVGPTEWHCHGVGSEKDTGLATPLWRKTEPRTGE